jgi:O-glycosyl hydrolase
MALRSPPARPIKLLVSLLVVAGLVCVGQARGQEPAEIRINRYRTHQTIVGFGGTMGWIHPPDERAEGVYDLIFKDLGASVLRLRALGSEEGEELSLELENDNADPYTFKWDLLPVKATERRNAAIAREARERGVKTIVPVAWSPPGWMKDNAKRTGMWGKLRDDVLDEYAELWAAYMVGMKREYGLEFQTISIQNEPDVTAEHHPGCMMAPELYARAMAAVSRRLEREGFDVRLLGPDVCNIFNLERYTLAMEEAGVSPGTPLLTHLYDESIPYGAVERDPERWKAARELAREHGRSLWFMETSNREGEGVEHGSYEEALIWAQKMHHALVHGNCEVVCYWALYFDKKGQSLVYSAATDVDGFQITPKYYTSRNYYRFIRPGMLRMDARCSDERLLVSAYRGATITDNQMVVVVVNPGYQARSVELRHGSPSTWLRYETSPERSCKEVPWEEGPADLPARSVTTFVWKQRDR